MGSIAFGFINKDIPDNVIAAGVPAKVIKKITRENEGSDKSPRP